MFANNHTVIDKCSDREQQRRQIGVTAIERDVVVGVYSNASKEQRCQINVAKKKKGRIFWGRVIQHWP